MTFMHEASATVNLSTIHAHAFCSCPKLQKLRITGNLEALSGHRSGDHFKLGLGKLILRI